MDGCNATAVTLFGSVDAYNAAAVYCHNTTILHELVNVSGGDYASTARLIPGP